VRPKIALIVDRPDWAFGNIARNLVRYLSDRFEFTVIPISYVGDLYQAILAAQGHDLIHFFWRRDVFWLHSEEYRNYLALRLGDADRFYREYLHSVPVTTAVYDHQFLDKDTVAEMRATYDFCADYYVSSRRLDYLYRELPGYPRPAAVLEDGVDLGLFRPRRLERLLEGNRPLVIGWAGNSLWATHKSDPKGFRTVLQPAIQQLQEEGVPVVGRFADRVDGLIPHRKMVDYYNSIDLYVCTSFTEGTPNPVLEAMACGVPVVTTDVGVVPEAFGPVQSRFILDSREIEHLKTAIRHIAEDASLREYLSRENMDRISGWDWSIKTRGFIDFFERSLQSMPRRYETSAVL
jgi:glycosyltransferase involved in cell wall biosynthesis